MNGYSPCRPRRTTNNLITRHHMLWQATRETCLECIGCEQYSPCRTSRTTNDLNTRCHMMSRRVM